MLFKKPSPQPIVELLPVDPVSDPTEWMLSNSFSKFVLLPGHVLYMCMFGYTFLHGCKVFKTLPPDASISYKFISMIFACTGGGILVPIFLNGIPVPLANDAYPIAILASFVLHYYCPTLREVAAMSNIMKVLLVFLYETSRAAVVVKLTMAAGKTIPASIFSFPVFGPIMCGAVGGCGGAFLPLNKGLEPIRDGMTSPALTALLGAAGYHLFVNTSLSEGCIDASKKAHVHVALFFILVGVVNTLGLTVQKSVAVKKPKVE
jgi:hypothetical protein